MSQAHPTSRPLITVRAIAGRALVVAGIVGAAVVWRMLHGDRFLLPTMHLHWPRPEVLAQASPLIRLHLAAAVIALLVGVVLLAGVKGTALHRTLGYTWIAAMLTTAASSLFIKALDPGHWSFIHFLSGWVIIAAPVGLVAIKRRNVALHRRMMTGLFVGGLMVAGAFTFLPGRLMFRVFFG